MALLGCFVAPLFAMTANAVAGAGGCLMWVTVGWDPAWAGPFVLEALARGQGYSHSMSAGGLEVMSKRTRLMPGTSLMMRAEMRLSVS